MQSSSDPLRRLATASTSRFSSDQQITDASILFPGPRPDESVAHEAAPDHEDDLPGWTNSTTDDSYFVGSGVKLLQHVGEGRLSPGEDHEPSDPQLQEVHHREWQSYHMESGWNPNNL